MSINYKSGDALDGPESAVGHGCNCRGGFGSGIAGAIASRWPNVRKKYSEFVSPEKLGQIQPVWTNDKIVVNMFTQLNYGRQKQLYVSYNALENCFKLLREWAEFEDVESIAVPRIGCGLANGSWDEVEKRINRAWENCEVELNIYSL